MMKVTSKAKMSKKDRRKLDNELRILWGMNPVTRVPPNSKAYSRTKVKKDARVYYGA